MFGVLLCKSPERENMSVRRASILLLMVFSGAISIFTQSSAPRRFKHRGKIETKHDKFKDQTTVSLKPYYVQGTAPTLDPTAGLEIYAAFVYTGQTLNKTPDAILFGNRINICQQLSIRTESRVNCTG